MNLSKGQGELFEEDCYPQKPIHLNSQLAFDKKSMQTWQKRIHSYQEPLFTNNCKSNIQQSLLELKPSQDSPVIPDLLSLAPLPLNFWQWPKAQHNGPAIYLVMDKPQAINSHILLYVGETVSAEKRWKGNHDCKEYLQAYLEACQKVGLTNLLSIRFWKDVPKDTKKRRSLEQQLIQTWLPAFNKETRVFWSTPFTN